VCTYTFAPLSASSGDGAGRMTQATVFTLTTRFTYDGDGARRVVEVVGQGTTTYTLDYARGNRILAETTPTSTVTYLYGHDCLGEFRDQEWLYYLNDGIGYVRQGTDEQSEVVSSWLFDPDGTVLEGPQGLVSHLICGGVYDWSTGLIFKGGRYFDPTLGIWLALVPLVVIQSWRGRKRRRRGFPWYVVVLVIVGVGGVLTACGKGTPTPEGDIPALEEECIDTSTPEPTPTPTLPTPILPTPTPTPELPTPTPDPNLFRITNEEVDAAGGMLNYLQSESEALLLARVGVGEGAHQNSLDQELVMWTVKARAAIGVSNNRSGSSTIKEEILFKHPNGGYQYSAIQYLIGITYPSTIDACANNVRRMGYPCDEDVKELETAYARAQVIVASSLESMPSGDPVDVRGFDSFTAPWTGSAGQKCRYGEWVEGVNRVAEQLAGATVFFDCWPDDNYQLGFPTPTPNP
jgi:hypothetical protein